MELFKIFGTIGINNADANKKIKETVSTAQTAAKNMSKGFESVGKTFQSIGKTFSEIGTTLSTVVTAPMVALGVSTAKTAINFLSLKESARTAFEVLLGSAESAQTMLDDLYTFAKTTPFSYDTYLTAGKTLVAMGVAAEDCIPYLEGITNAAIATGTGQAGVDSLAQALGRMQSSGKVTLETLNVLTYSGIPAIKILANEYGVTTEEMYKMISSGEILADKALPKLIKGMQEGTEGAAGATAAYGGLAKEMKGTLSGSVDSLSSKFRNMAIEIWNAEEAYPELIKVIQDFTSCLDVLPKIFESVSLAAVPALQTISDKLKTFKEYLDGLSPEQLQKVGNVILGLAAAGPGLLIAGKAFNLIGSASKGLGSVFSILSKINFSGLANEIFNLGTGYLKLLNPMNLFKGAASGLQSVMGFLAQKVATVALTFNLSGGGLSGVLAVAQGALGGLGSAFTSLIGTISPVAVVVGAIVAVFITLKENWDKVVATFQNFINNTGITEKFNQIKESVAPLMEKIQGLKDLFVVIGTTIIAILQPAIAVLAGLFNGVVTAIAPLMTAIGGLLDILGGLGSLIVGIFTGDMEKVQESLNKIWQGIVDLFSGLWETVSGFLVGFVQGLWGWVSGLWEASGLGSFFSNLWTNISTWLTTVVTNIGTWFTDLGTSIGQWVTDAWNTVKEKTSNAWETIKTAVRDAINTVKDTVSKVFNDIKATIANIWDTIKTKISDTWNGIKTAVSNAINNVKDTISKIFNDIKTTITNTWDTIKTKISDTWNGIKTSVSDAVGNVKKSVSDAFDKVKSKVSDVWNGIKSAIEKPINTAKDIVKDAIDKIKGFFNFSFSWPKLKMPHFGISPSGWKIGDLLKGSIPKLSIDWYAKAMDDGMILNDPTIFGLSKNGTLLGGGEAGSETIVGTESLMDMIQRASNNSDIYLAERLDKILMYLQVALPELTNRQLVLDTGTIAGALTPAINKNLGTITSSIARGRSY